MNVLELKGGYMKCVYFSIFELILIDLFDFVPDF